VIELSGCSVRNAVRWARAHHDGEEPDVSHA
jgi:hypothetical protein